VFPTLATLSGISVQVVPSSEVGNELSQLDFLECYEISTTGVRASRHLLSKIDQFQSASFDDDDQFRIEKRN
jgi:hypothetical protein